VVAFGDGFDWHVVFSLGVGNGFLALYESAITKKEQELGGRLRVGRRVRER
jgi:hypothetical protein